MPTLHTNPLVQSTLLHSYTPYILCAPTNIPTIHTNPYISIYQPYKRPYTLLTYPTTTYLPNITTIPLQTYKTLHTYPTPTYLPYPYNPYSPTHPTPYTACWPYPCTPAQWARGWALRLRFASDGILFAATSIGETITFEFVRASWWREGCWISPKTCNSGRMHNHFFFGVWNPHTAENYTSMCMSLNMKWHIYVSYTTYNLSKKN